MASEAIHGADALRSDRAAILGVMALFVAMWLAINPTGNFPVNDDWAYSFAARAILETGQFRLTGFSAPNLFAQAYWGALFCLPFGFSHEALRLSTVVLALLGLFATHRLMRELGAGPVTAACAALALACNPLYLQLSASFMTDVPFTALSVTAFWFYARGVRRDRLGWIVAAYAVALLALMVRQFGVLLPLSFGVALLVRRGISWRTLALSVAPVLLFAAVHVLFQHWVVATGRAPKFAEAITAIKPVDTEMRHRIRFYPLAIIPYFGLMVLPFTACLFAGLAWTRPRGTALRAALLVLAATGLLMLLLVWDSKLVPSFGNLLTRYGLGPLTLRDTWVLNLNAPIWPFASKFWAVVSLLACFATALIGLFAARLATALVTHLRRLDRVSAVWPQAMLLAFVASSTLAILYAVLLENIFDRYFIAFVVPLCACLYLWLRPDDRLVRSRWPVAVAPVLACILYGVPAAHDYFAFSRARWRAYDLLRSEGVPATQIDGGFEISGTYLYDVNYVEHEDVSHWWIVDDTYTISLGPTPGYSTEREFPFSRWFWPPGYDVRIMHLLIGLTSDSRSASPALAGRS